MDSLRAARPLCGRRWSAPEEQIVPNRCALMSGPAYMRLQVLVFGVARSNCPASVPLHAVTKRVVILIPLVAPSRPEGCSELGAGHVRRAEVAAVDAINGHPVWCTTNDSSAGVQRMRELVGKFTTPHPAVPAEVD
eukprot:CAMPEP_0174750420 /NCGR_PEP_ID=MMETSP1094-20130205/97720_1 /TAXON_ID=156173 /ORGANISM="Chrysochromulina brevifilum, Strain UTEX LB 985" /LENGTH=135 /DNA_ID=CAMNT_0015955779 /DNA_START=211 /DNA_END=618 /DNA_ORIENTATION=+